MQENWMDQDPCRSWWGLLQPKHVYPIALSPNPSELQTNGWHSLSEISAFNISKSSRSNSNPNDAVAALYHIGR